MAYNTKAIKKDVNGKPIPQVYNPAIDDYEALKGDSGAARHVLYGPDGSPVGTAGGKLGVRDDEVAQALAALLTQLDTALPAGNNKIGKVDVEVSALPAGAATEAKQDSVISELQAIEGKDFATQTTLAAILEKIISAPATEAKQNSLETVLKAIRDSAGIKKITDALPAGTNKIGKVDVDSSALPTGAATAAKQDSLLTQTDIKLSALRDAIRGVDDKTLSDLAASLFFITQNMLSEGDFIAKADIKMSALRDAITAAGENAKTLKDLHDKLTSLETEIKAIKDTAGIKKINDTVDVQLSGSKMELYGASINDRPAANTAPAGVTFTIVDRDLDKNWISDGTNWEEV